MSHPYPISESGAGWVSRAADLAARVLAPHAADVDARARFPEEAVAALRAEGFLGLCLPTEAGGAGEGPATFAAVVEELAKACSSTAMIYVMHVTSAQVIAQSPTLGDRDSVVAAIAKGEHLTTLAFSEKGSRSQFWAPVSKLTEYGVGFRTSAYKSWVTTAHNAQSYVSSARMPGASAPMESTLYLVRVGRPGVRIDGGFDGLGLRGNDSAPVAIEDLRVEAGDLLTPNGEGANGMLGLVLPWFTIGTAAMAHGLCLAATTATAGHLAGTGFTHSGQALRDLPNLRARVAQMSVRTEQARALLGHTLRLMAEGDATTPLFVLQTRASSLEAAIEVTDLGMKACGGAAFSKHNGLERLFRDARAGWVMAPTVDHVHDFIGKALTGLPLF